MYVLCMYVYINNKHLEGALRLRRAGRVPGWAACNSNILLLLIIIIIIVIIVIIIIILGNGPVGCSHRFVWRRGPAWSGPARAPSG